MSDIELSVVLADTGGGWSIDAAVRALNESCLSLVTELIVVRTAGHRGPDVPRLDFSAVRVEQSRSGVLTPHLWGTGATFARGRVVAFTTDQQRVGRSWARALCETIDKGVVGVGGPIVLSPHADSGTTAAYFVRFSAFTPEAWPGIAPARDVAGDNAAYERAAVVRHDDLLREGFWEVEFHRRFEREGRQLQMVPGAVATLAGPMSFRALMSQRFLHAREFGAARVRRHGESRTKLLLSAPLVPFVLLGRMGRRTMSAGRYRRQFVRSLPALFVLAVAWAAGEVFGGLGHGRER